MAPPSVRTVQIYRGAVAFIVLQLAGLAIAGYFPALVNYLPNRIYLTSETAPPPMNPRLQRCIEERVFAIYDERGADLLAGAESMRGLDLLALPEPWQDRLDEHFDQVGATLALVDEARRTEAERAAYEPDYRPLHREVRDIEKQIRKLDDDLRELDKRRTLLERSGGSDADIRAVEERIAAEQGERAALGATLPVEWEDSRGKYVALLEAEKKALGAYRQNVDGAYETLMQLRAEIDQAEALEALGARIEDLRAIAVGGEPDAAMKAMKEVESALGALDGTGDIKRRVSKARRALKGAQPDREKADGLLAEALALHSESVTWRRAAAEGLGEALSRYDESLTGTIGLRMQRHLSTEEAKEVAACQASHRDLSLNF